MEPISAQALKSVGCEAPGSRIYPPFNVEGNVRIGDTTVWPNVSFGRHSYINGGYIRDNTSIGRYCSIGRNVSITAGDHPLDGLTTHPVAWQCAARPARPSESMRAQKSAKTSIGHDVWIGDNVVVVAGVSIGTGSVIGANAVVTKDVPPYSIVGGVPARLIRARFPAEIAEALLASEWWTVPQAALITLNFNDVAACLREFPRLRQTFGTDEFEFHTIE